MGSNGHGHDHSHGVRIDADRRYLSGALALIVAFLIAEVIVGLIAGSLALISDAGHMLTDAASIVLALIAIRLAAKPAKGRWTYGYQRAEILSAQANGLTLLLLAAWFVYEAIHRLITPPQVQGLLVFVTAVVGIGVNIGAAWLISKANRTSLNIEGAYQHILNDLYAFIATAIAGLVVMLTGFARADAIAALVVAALMIMAGYRLVRDSGRIFLEAAPADQDPDIIGPAMAQQPGVTEVHDLHIWAVTSGIPALSAHVLVEPGGDCHAVRRELESLLQGTFQVRHTTLQVDHAAGSGTAALGMPATGGGFGRHPGDDGVHRAELEPDCADPHGPRHHPDPGRPRPPAADQLPGTSSTAAERSRASSEIRPR